MNEKINKGRTRILNYPRNSLLYKIYLWIKGRHWWIIAFTAVILFALETSDYFRHNYDPVHIIEFIIYIGLLLVVGVLVDLLIAEIDTLAQTKKILDIKHKISLEFAGIHEWDGLMDQIVRIPSTVAPVGQTCLYLLDGISGQYAQTMQWDGGEGRKSGNCSLEICENCQQLNPVNEKNFGECESYPLSGMEGKKYCMALRYGERTPGIMLFNLEEDQKLTARQREIFENISDEIGIALQTGQDRHALYEMRTSETALAERREVSHYLHDHLGQSLGYLHIKMDQLLMEKDHLTVDQVFDDLVQMRKAVNDSYEIVRGILERIHLETAPSLTNLLMEHARRVSERANFKVNFKTRGKPVRLTPEIERAIFYAFEESLSNAEKHAQASRIDINAEWQRDQFSLTISDDGVGFDPESVDTDQHFGMEILNERMAKVNGRITLTSSENSGTVVNINVPKPAAELRMSGDIE